MVLTDPSVSRRHAEVYKDATGWRIRDLGSSSGVRVDGVRHEECPLRDGMVIALGKQLLNVQIPPPTESGTGVLASRTLADFMLVQGLQGGEDDPKISDLGRVVRLAAAIREQWPEIAILVSSGRVFPSEAALPQGVGFLAKPWRIDEVVNRVAELL